MHIQAMSYHELIARGVTEKFARVLSDPKSYHPDLDIIIGKSDWDYFIPKDATDIVPLWDSNADTFARWRKGGKLEYVKLFHDDPEWSLIALSEQGIMAHLWTHWIDFKQADEEECNSFAQAIGFKYCDKALKLWEKDFDTFDEWKRELKG